MSFLKASKSSISNPISPKLSTYLPDGYGRDSYIFNNNGGLSKSGQRIIDTNNNNNCNLKIAYSR
jgi:hypothetical protein